MSNFPNPLRRFASTSIGWAGLVLALAGLWWTLTEGAVDAWYTGVPAIALVVVASVATLAFVRLHGGRDKT